MILINYDSQCSLGDAHLITDLLFFKQLMYIPELVPVFVVCGKEGEKKLVISQFQDAIIFSSIRKVIRKE